MTTTKIITFKAIEKLKKIRFFINLIFFSVSFKVENLKLRGITKYTYIHTYIYGIFSSCSSEPSLIYK